MPAVHIWIKKEDWARWQSITNKPLWLHEALTGEPFTFHPNMVMPTTLQEGNNPNDPSYSAVVRPDMPTMDNVNRASKPKDQT